MSLVGPRPHALSHDREYEQRISRYARRHNVKPGITGWAQINGYRGETDTEEKMRKRVEYDLFYIDNWSLWLDLKIMVRTVLRARRIRTPTDRPIADRRRPFQIKLMEYSEGRLVPAKADRAWGFSRPAPK